MQATAEMFLRQLIRRMAVRLAEDLEPVPPSYSAAYRSGSLPGSSAAAAGPAMGMMPTGQGAAAGNSKMGKRYYD